MNRGNLIRQIRKKKTFLCIGLDSDIDKIPKFLWLEKNPIFSFNKSIIDKTANYCIAYKINTAFYENEYWGEMKMTVDYIKKNYPELLIIIDGKRGDIGSSSDMYAKNLYYNIGAHALTISPYMGNESIKPFLKNKGKWSIILAYTSNSSAESFQNLILKTGKRLYEKIIIETRKIGSINNTMYVVGSKDKSAMIKARKIIPNHFILVTGIGSQGGNLSNVCKYLINKDFGIIVNSSRNIIYSSKNRDFAEKAMVEAKKFKSNVSIFFK